jgi:alanine-glyoxylate transaminase/serine-glyoxylate transaminase/serine-pyruvate transaminase
VSGYMREFIPQERLLLGAGPSNANPRVLRAMTQPLLGYLDSDFLQLLDDVRAMLKSLFHTHSDLTLAVSGTGTSGMEASLCNILEPGDLAIVAVNGFFGLRMTDIASRCGATVVQINTEWGRPVDPEAIKQELAKHRRVKAVALVHGETSTGVLTPLEEIADLAHSYDATYIVDAVTSLGGVDIAVDDWGVDVCYSGTQKCLGCPPGLSPITFGDRALQIINTRQTKPHSFYLDMALLGAYWASTTTRRAYHHTAPTSMLYGLREGLRIIFEEGPEQRVRRHQASAQSLRSGLEALGLKLFAENGYRLDSLTAVYIPDSIEDEPVRRALVKDYNIEIGGGLGELRGKIWRIGLMGENATHGNVLFLLSALEQVLNRFGSHLSLGNGVAAAERALVAYQASIA